MDRNQQIEYCSYCKNRSFDKTNGLVCGLTMTIPSIEETCPDLILDNKVVEKKNNVSSNQTDTKKANRDIIIGGVILTIGIVLTVLDLGRIFYGAIIYGGAKLIFGLSDSNK